MESTRSRMILVATLVCFFAVGMAALLNYYKYRGTADRIHAHQAAFIVAADTPSCNYLISCGNNIEAAGGVVGVDPEAEDAVIDDADLAYS